MTPQTDAATDPIMERLDDQIAWYNGKSVSHKRSFKTMKVAEIVAAALIPFFAAANLPHALWIDGALGVIITILEGLLQLNQNQQNWVACRSTCETLKHEKFIYLARSGPYSGAADPYALLAERVESIVSQENAKWVNITQQIGAAKHT